MRTLVIGLGNPYLTDDGVGVRVAHAVHAKLPPDANVDVRELSLGGLRLVEAMFGYDRVVIADAFVRPDVPPGHLVRVCLEDIEDSFPIHSFSPHDASLITAMKAGRAAGFPVPDDLVIIGIGVSTVYDFGEELTPEVERAVPDAVDAVLAELDVVKVDE